LSLLTPFRFSEQSSFLLSEGLYQKPEQLNLDPLLTDLNKWLTKVKNNYV